jgi:hypothetical protein
MNGDIQKIVDELALVNNMEKIERTSEVFLNKKSEIRFTFFLQYSGSEREIL